MRKMAPALLLAVSTLTLGCSKETPATPGGSGRSAEVSTENEGPLVTKFRIGPTIDADGLVSREADTIQPGEGVHISFVVENVPKDTPIRAVWRDAALRDISEEQKPLPSNGFVSFTMKDAATLAPGDYVVEFSRAEPAAPSGWGSLGTKTFKVGPRPGA